MKMTWQPTGAAEAVTLGDDAEKHAVVVEQLGAASMEQLDQLMRGDYVRRTPRGNVAGEVVFVASKAFDTYAETWTQFATEYGRLDQQGTLSILEGSSVLNYANAILKGVQRLFDEHHRGVRTGVRYIFGVASLEAAV